MYVVHTSRFNLITLVHGLKLNSGGQIYLLKEEYMVYYGFSMLPTFQHPLLHLPQMCGCMASIKMVLIISYTCHLCKLGIHWESENIFCFVFCFNFNDFTLEKKKQSNCNLRNLNIGIKDPKSVKWDGNWNELALTVVRALVSINEGRVYLDAMKPELGHTILELGLCDIFQN